MCQRLLPPWLRPFLTPWQGDPLLHGGHSPCTSVWQAMCLQQAFPAKSNVPAGTPDLRRKLSRGCPRVHVSMCTCVCMCTCVDCTSCLAAYLRTDTHCDEALCCFIQKGKPCDLEDFPHRGFRQVVGNTLLLGYKEIRKRPLKTPGPKSVAVQAAIT